MFVIYLQSNTKDATRQPLDPNMVGDESKKPCCLSLSLTKWAKNHYVPFIMRPSVKVSLFNLMVTMNHRRSFLMQ